MSIKEVIVDFILKGIKQGDLVEFTLEKTR